MIAKIIYGGIFGALIGAVTGWFVFESLASMIGIGSAMAASICGALLASSPEDDGL